MEKVKVFHDRSGNTLTVWFGEPQDEYICEETGEEIILMKDKSGQVIGFAEEVEAVTHLRYVQLYKSLKQPLEFTSSLF